MNVYTIADNIISPLGADTSQNFKAMLRGESAISYINHPYFFQEPIHAASIGYHLLEEQFGQQGQKQQFTRLEKGLILSIRSVLDRVPGIDKKKLVLIISSTKGNIDLIGKEAPAGIAADRITLPAMARAVNGYFKLPNEPVVVSNACISGISALLVARKLIGMGLYDHALVAGGDLLHEFIISGFHSLKAISDQPCQPYDSERKGISLGEAFGTILVSKDAGLRQQKESFSMIAGGGQSNDANHISGPSRTGKGLKIAVNKALKDAGLPKESLAYINAHGTATVFNDEMEAIAFNDLGLQNLPLNSLKGYFGHTLGAAGVIESVITLWQLNRKTLLKTSGYNQAGVSQELNVLKEHGQLTDAEAVLKTGSGFGGCNGAVIFRKAWN